jgi:hypothetical protein
MVGSKRISPTTVREPIEASGLPHVVGYWWLAPSRPMCLRCLPANYSNSNLSRYMDVTTNRHRCLQCYIPGIENRRFSESASV